VSTTASGITTIGLVIIPSTNQDKAIEFYEALGFEKRTDVPMGDKYRWVEVYPRAGRRASRSRLPRVPTPPRRSRPASACPPTTSSGPTPT